MPPHDPPVGATVVDRREARAALLDPERLRQLRATGLLDSPSERDFDRIARLAARMLEVPVALVSLVDADRQFFKSCIGLPEPWASRRQTPLSHSFCRFVLSGEPLVIEDAREHPLTRGNPAIEELGVIAYAGIPLRSGPDGEVLGSFCVIDHEPRHWQPEELELLRDLAASVASEIELRLAWGEAERRADALGSAVESLQRAERALQRAAAAREEMTAVISHDLRSPLNTVALNAQVLAASDLPARDHDRQLGRIADAVRQMQGLLQDLLDVAQIEARQLSVRARPERVGDLLERARDAFEDEAGDRGIELAVEAGGDELRVTADRDRVQQALANLLSNALRHTPETGRVVLSAERAGGFGRLRVADTGPGIDPELRGKIFDRFWRQRGGTQGAGLGLAITRGIVEAHGGTIEVEPNPGGGAAFVFTLPLAEGD